MRITIIAFIFVVALISSNCTNLRNIVAGSNFYAAGQISNSSGSRTSLNKSSLESSSSREGSLYARNGKNVVAKSYDNDSSLKASSLNYQNSQYNNFKAGGVIKSNKFIAH